MEPHWPVRHYRVLIGLLQYNIPGIRFWLCPAFRRIVAIVIPQHKILLFPYFNLLWEYRARYCYVIHLYPALWQGFRQCKQNRIFLH